MDLLNFRFDHRYSLNHPPQITTKQDVSSLQPGHKFFVVGLIDDIDFIEGELHWKQNQMYQTATFKLNLT